MKDALRAILKNAKNDHTDESRRRAEICAECPLKQAAFYADFVKSKIENINGYVCSLCDCPLSTKIFASEPQNICEKWSQQ